MIRVRVRVKEIGADLYELSWDDRWVTVHTASDPRLIVTDKGRELKPGSPRWHTFDSAVTRWLDRSRA